MQQLPDEEIYSQIEQWIDDLAEGKSEQAFQRFEYAQDTEWTPIFLQQVIEGYGLPEPHPSGKRFTVSPRHLAQGGPPRRTIKRGGLPTNVLAIVEHDLPLNGAWSDLTALFYVELRNNGYSLVLQEIHVL